MSVLQNRQSGSVTCVERASSRPTTVITTEIVRFYWQNFWPILDPPDHNRDMEDQDLIYHQLEKIDMDEEMRRNHFEVNVKPNLEKFKERLKAEREYLRIYEKMAKEQIDRKLGW